MRAVIVLLLVFSTTLIGLGKPPSQTPEDQLSPNESQEVDQFVREFNKRLRLTRDLTPFQTEPLAREMSDKVLLDKGFSKPVSKDLISRSNLKELRRLWIAMLNLGYLSELYIYARTSVKGLGRTSELPLAQQYPSDVVRLMKRNPLLSKWLEENDSDSSEQIAKTIEQLRSLTSTYQKAATLMRARFKAHPPEQTRQYRQNIAYLSKHLGVVRISTCNSEKDCAGLPLHTKTITVNIPALTLMLVRIDGQLKILVIGKIDD
jgi:hypothetical protein